MALITLLRHGRTAANAGGLLQGRVDNTLDEHGRPQAQAAADALAPVDRVIARPHERERDTAEAYGSPDENDERWNEMDNGDWDGKPMRDVPADVWSRWRTDLDLRPPGGETLVELGHRVRESLDELTQQDLPAHTVIVSHVSPIKAAVAWVLGVGDEISWRTRLGTGAYSQLVVDGDHRALAAFNIVPTPA